IDGVKCETYEKVIITLPDEYSGTVINALNERKGILESIESNLEYTKITFLVPTRGIIGYRSQFINTTKGEGIMVKSFHSYMPCVGKIQGRKNGVLVSMENGKTMGYSLWNLEDRGTLIVTPATNVYIGMIVGIHNRIEDLNVNPCKNTRLKRLLARTSSSFARRTGGTIGRARIRIVVFRAGFRHVYAFHSLAVDEISRCARTCGRFRRHERSAFCGRFVHSGLFRFFYLFRRRFFFRVVHRFFFRFYGFLLFFFFRRRRFRSFFRLRFVFHGFRNGRVYGLRFFRFFRFLCGLFRFFRFRRFLRRFRRLFFFRFAFRFFRRCLRFRRARFFGFSRRLRLRFAFRLLCFQRGKFLYHFRKAFFGGR
ncbi:MAG: hypothetical protein IJB97_00680, partial [Clostridia bacterium]|nr:hypothetical protein [Clostridia bacterium]